MAKYAKLNPWALGVAGAFIGFVSWLIGLFWHGIMAQSSIMEAMHPGTSHMYPLMLTGLMLVLVITGFVFGWLAAYVYNWALKFKT